METKQKNIFCSKGVLTNESSVETFFLSRLISRLGYPDNRIRTKESIHELTIGRGSRKEKYKPDYILYDASNNPIIVIDAKSPSERPADFHYQVSGYALLLNQKFADKNPVRYCILSNGNVFIVYPWDSESPLYYLEFDDFNDENAKFLELKANLSYEAFNQMEATKDVFEFYRPEIRYLMNIFDKCHNMIWKKEKKGPTEAFYEFAKIMFLKINEDRKLHDKIKEGKPIKKDDWVFSVEWIDRNKDTVTNPFDKILFQELQATLEKKIQKKEKKRIFDKDEGLNLKPSTIREVVKTLQNFDLYGIDEDLNGRMFETFLNATVKGKELGQYFTPRSVVKYMSDASNPKVTKQKADYVLDGCCGSAGFLIEVMAVMTTKANNLSQLTSKERTDLKEKICNHHLWGADANDKISRIARLNMYLHGDGGSKIFKADFLDKKIAIEKGIDDETEEGLKELKGELIDKAMKFNIVLTNPPFSMKYEKKDKEDKKILDEYDIAEIDGVMPASVKSNVLFVERYYDLLADNGELLTIIDDTILNGSGKDNQHFRDFILERFIVKQVISLPFNTFFKAQANIKTSILHLKKKEEGEKQGDIFMAITNNIGHDDHMKDTPHLNNLPVVLNSYKEFEEMGKLDETIMESAIKSETLSCPLQIFKINASDLSRVRLDAFFYSPILRKLKKKLKKLESDGKVELKRGFDFVMVKPVNKAAKEEMEGEKFKYAEIADFNRGGDIINYAEDAFEKLTTRARLRVKEGDVIFAKNISSRGLACIIPKWFDGNLVTTGFMSIRPRSDDERLLLWAALRSDIFRTQIYYMAITASQPEIRDHIFKDEMLIPFPKDAGLKSKIINNSKRIRDMRESIVEELKISVDLEKDIMGQ